MTTRSRIPTDSRPCARLDIRGFSCDLHVHNGRSHREITIQIGDVPQGQTYRDYADAELAELGWRRTTDWETDGDGWPAAAIARIERGVQ